MTPWQQLLADREAAAQRKDPCANLCSLATVDSGGLPQVRTLVLRSLAGERLGLFVNSTSPKWEQLQVPVAVLVYLASLQVQYRIRASLVALAKSEVDSSWQLRPDTPKRLDYFYESGSPQSTNVVSREQLLQNLDTLVPEVPAMAPGSAQGLVLQPSELERLDLNADGEPHRRERFELRAGQWQQHTLVP